MFDLKIIDVFIGILLVFSIYSLLATIVLEILVSIIRLRSNNLRLAIKRMLTDDKPENLLHNLSLAISSIKNSLFDLLCYLGITNPSKKDDAGFLYKLRSNKDSPDSQFYNHVIIKGLTSGGWKRKPSYIEARTFSDTLLSLLARNAYKDDVDEVDEADGDEIVIEADVFDPEAIESGIINFFKSNPETQSLLLNYLNKSQGDIDKFRNYLELWFNDTIERCIGWYKRKNSLLLFILGFFIAASFNVDSIGIVKELSKNKKARDYLVSVASDSTQLQGYINLLEDTKHKKDSLLAEKDSLMNLALAQTSDSIKTRANLIKTDSLLLENEKKVTESISQLKGLQNDLLNDANGINNALNIARPAGFSFFPKKDSLVYYYFCHNDSLQINWKKSKGKYKSLSYHCVSWRADGILCNIAPDAVKSLALNNPKTCKVKPSFKRLRYFLAMVGSNNFHFLGYFLTAIAISLGAPFWFDLLNKVVNLRNSVKKLTNNEQGQSKQTNSDLETNTEG